MTRGSDREGAPPAGEEYVLGERESMAEGVVARVAEITGAAMAERGRRPTPEEILVAEDASVLRRTWSLREGDLEIGLQYTGFDLYAWTEDHATGAKDGMSQAGEGRSFQDLVDFFVAAVEAGRSSAPSAPGR